MVVHVARGGIEIGRFSVEELQEKITYGVVRPSDQAWIAGQEEWKQVSELFEIEWPEALMRLSGGTGAKKQARGVPG